MNSVEMTRNQRQKSSTCICLGLYFAILPFDFLEFGSLGSVTRIIAILPILLAIFANGRNWRIRRDPVSRWLFFFVLLAVLSSIYTVSSTHTSDSLKTLLMNAVMVFIVGGTRDYTKVEREFLTKCLVIGSWITVFMVVIFGTVQYGRTTIIIGETYQDPNYLCGYMIFALVFHLSEFFRSRKILHIGLSAIIFVAVIMTGSRGAMLGIFACTIACILTFGKESGQTLKTIIIAALGVAIAYFILSQFVLNQIDSVILTRFTRAYLAEKGSTGRTLIWSYLLNKFMESGLFRKLFGNGYGTTVVVNQVVRHGGKVAHNLYIDSLITLGVLGCIEMIALHISCLIESKRNHNMFYFCTMIGYMGLCLSMSLTSYKPLWATIIMILINNCYTESEEQIEND